MRLVFSGYTGKKRRGGCRGDYLQLIRREFFFRLRGSFFSGCGSPLTCFPVTRGSRVLKKSARGVPAGIISSSFGGCFFQVAGSFFQVILEKTGPRRPANYLSTESGSFFSDDFFFQVIRIKKVSYMRHFFLSRQEKILWTRKNTFRDPHLVVFHWFYKGWSHFGPFFRPVFFKYVERRNRICQF